MVSSIKADVNKQQALLLTDEQLEQWDRDGYLIVPGLFDPDEVAAIRERFDQLAEGDFIPGHWEPKTVHADETKKNDPLYRYPRVLHPHRICELSKRMMLHSRIDAALRQLLGEEAVACQSMFYFKPPGSRGQALHQDNLYLKVAPTTCIAAWVAIDRALPENGGMYVVPGSHKLDILCPDEADTGESFTGHLVNVPKGMKAIPAEMQPGDGLFFNGSVIHGSGRNKTETEWRRAFICHYMPRASSHVSKFYFPVLDFTGREISYEEATGGGPCGDAPIPSSYAREGDL